MKRLLWLSHLVPWPPKGGVLQRSYYLLRELAREFDVHLLAFNQQALLNNPGDVEEARSALTDLCRVLDIVEIPSDRSRAHFLALALKSVMTASPYTLNWLQSPKYHQALQKARREHSYDLIHCDTISLAPYLTDDIHDLCRTVLNHHNIESHMMARRAEKERNPVKSLYFSLEARKLRAAERKYCNKFALNITCSDLDSDRLIEETGAQAVEAIPNGVDLAYFSPTGLPEEEGTLVWAGGLSWYPNQAAMRFFFDGVWPLLSAQYPGVRIEVIGRNPPQWLQQIAAADGAVRVTGFVDDVRPYLERAAVYVCPIMDGGGTKLKILDALAMRKALVAHPIACEGIAVEDEQHVLLAREPGDFVHQIGRLLGDPDLRHRLGENGRRLMEERYSYEKIGQKLRSRYARL